MPLADPKPLLLGNGNSNRAQTLNRNVSCNLAKAEPNQVAGCSDDEAGGSYFWNVPQKMLQIERKVRGDTAP